MAQYDRMAVTVNELSGKVAIVTGTSRGVGVGIAHELLRAGATVIGCSRSPMDNIPAVEPEWAPRASQKVCDQGDFRSIDAFITEVVAAHGRIDILVNNAGITRDMTFKKMTKNDWDAVMRTNLDSCFNMTKQVMDGMVERSWGRVINVASVNGQKGAFGQTNYSAAKAGIHGFTKALALEVAKKGVTVNTISPGYIGTKMVTAIPKEILDSKILPQIPTGRLGKPEEIAGLIIYLCSQEAAFVTGANISINGGQHMY